MERFNQLFSRKSLLTYTAVAAVLAVVIIGILVAIPKNREKSIPVKSTNATSLTSVYVDEQNNTNGSNTTRTTAGSQITIDVGENNKDPNPGSPQIAVNGSVSAGTKVAPTTNPPKVSEQSSNHTPDKGGVYL